jgi:MarR family transcriptional regulator, organic hydroperoxide resistance regulator
MAAPATRRHVSPASQAWELIGELFQTYGRRRFWTIVSEFDLSPPQALALKHLRPGAPMPMSDLACRLHCDNSNVTGIVDRLEDRGLVERRSAPHDRRVKMLVVTDKGAALREQLSEALMQAPEPLTHLSPAEQESLRDLLAKALGRAG